MGTSTLKHEVLISVIRIVNTYISLYGTVSSVRTAKGKEILEETFSETVFFLCRITSKTITTVMMMATKIATAVPTMIEVKCRGVAGSSMMVGMVVVLEFVDDNGGSGLVEMLLVMEMVDGEHIEPGDCLNMSSCFAFELTQATPQSLWLKDAAPSNMLTMLVT